MVDVNLPTDRFWLVAQPKHGEGEYADRHAEIHFWLPVQLEHDEDEYAD